MLLTMNETAETSKNPWQVGDILEKTLPQRAQQASDKLRAMLTTKIIIELSETRRRYLIDWTSKEMKVSLVSPEVGADTVMRMTEKNFQAIVKGELNSQLAFVSGAVALTGKTEPAMYFFNLLLE